MNKYLSIMMLLMLCFTFDARAADVTVAWDANSEPDLAGYRLYRRAYDGTYDYTTPIWEGTETRATVDVPIQSAFVVRAFDDAGNVSGDSNEAATWDGSPANPTGCRVE